MALDVLCCRRKHQRAPHCPHDVRVVSAVAGARRDQTRSHRPSRRGYGETEAPEAVKGYGPGSELVRAGLAQKGSRTMTRRRTMTIHAGEPTRTEGQSPTPEHILQLGLGFWGSKTLLSAVELGLFSELAKGPLDAEGLRQRLGLHQRSARDFFDALVAFGMLDRENDRYANTTETDLFLDHAKPSYVGGLLEMFNARLFRFWGTLTEGLRTGEPQNE